MRASLSSLVWLITISTLAVTALADPIIQNGSFEQVQIASPFDSSSAANVPGWTHSGAVGDALLWAIGYSDGGGSVTTAGQGNQFVTLGGGFDSRGTADWSTTIITGLAVGTSYVLSFMTATELGFGAEPGGPQSMTVGFVSGSNSASRAFTSPDSTAAYWRTWVAQTYTFSASATSAVVEFSVTNQQYDMGLDDVAVATASTTTPEPSSLLLLLAGLAVTAYLMPRKSRAG